MFHATDGLYFERLADGSVAVTKMNTPKKDSGIAMRFEIDASTWASVVASVCALGESRDTFEIADELHNMTELPVDEDEPEDDDQFYPEVEPGDEGD